MLRPMQGLELDNCSLLTSVCLDLPRLRNISLVHCRKYVSVSFFFYRKVLQLYYSSLSFSVACVLVPLDNTLFFFFCSSLSCLIYFLNCFLGRFADLNLRAVTLSSIQVSNCGALHRINITSNSLQVCLIIMSGFFSMLLYTMAV